MAVPKLPAVPKDIAFALKAIANGSASEGQQVSALQWILLEACAIQSVSYTAGDAFATAFAEGRRFAGLLIAGAVQAKPARAPAMKSKPIREAKPDETK